ncbi:MAG: hypothetical protein LBG30_00685 [Odoribacteraceae bacterium]|nr:hypothetical protein [Odoribacteraceae bacterium]
MKKRISIMMLFALTLLLPACNRGGAEEWYKQGLLELSEDNEEEAIKWLAKAADKKHAPSMTLLGSRLIEKDAERARALFNEASGLGYGPAMVYLAACNLGEIGGEKNVTLAISWLERALRGTDLTDPQREAAHELIMEYGADNDDEEEEEEEEEEDDDDYEDNEGLNGRELFVKGVQALKEKNMSVARDYLMKSLHQDYAPAATALGNFTQSAEPENESIFLGLYMAAARMGEPVAHVKLAKFFLEKKDNERAIYWLEKVVKSGNLDEEDQQTNEDLLRGLDPSRLIPENVKGWAKKGSGLFVAEDYAGAAEWFLKAAKEGHVHAQLMLGLCYRLGRGVPADPKESLAWFHKAADQGCVDAWLILGTMYYSGQKVEKNLPLALKWIEKAYQSGVLRDTAASGAEMMLLTLKGVVDTEEE